MKDKEALVIQEKVEVFLSRTERLLYPEHVLFDAEFSASKEPVPFDKRLKGAEYRRISEGEAWGETWDSAWFKLTGRVPKEWKGRTVVANLDFNGEGLIFSSGGIPVRGVSSFSALAHPYTLDRHVLYEKCSGGEAVELWVEAAANGCFGVRQEPDPGKSSPDRHGKYEGRVNRLRLAVFDKPFWEYRLDLEFLLSLSKYLHSSSVRRNRVLKALEDSLDVFRYNMGNLQKARKALERMFKSGASDSDLSVLAVGHAHIDTAWLWPVSETVRKCARTFANQCHLIEKYPGYVFGASQPQHFAFLRDNYPALYLKVKKHVKEGRIEPQGGMWVEADCNIISGESMVRQILHGKNFFMDEFGVDVRNLWLPDVFGYSAAMPQILRKSGIDFFLTNKLSWNVVNKFPHNTFKWCGVDGTEVITHFPPDRDYNCSLTPEMMGKGRDNFEENYFLDEFISLFGVGDGGGGPKEEHLERGLRMADIEGLPRLGFGPAQSFFDRLSKHHAKLKTWRGELYLEAHRGTFTTQGMVKKLNRTLENKLRAAEFLCSCMPLSKYPQKDLDGVWKKLLLNQFHDIIPGSSIARVYETTRAELMEGIEKTDEIARRAAASIFEKDSDALLLFNCLSHEYEGAVELPDSWRGCGAVDADGNELQSQDEAGGTIVLASVPAQGFKTLYKSGRAPKSAKAVAGKLVLENELVRYEFRKDGCIVSAYDKECGRELVSGDNFCNRLSLYGDYPNRYDAWDIDQFYESQLVEHARAVDCSKVSSGNVRSTIVFELEIGSSTISQEAVLHHHSKRLDFKTTVNWREDHHMLRVAFPLSLSSNTRALFDMQYSHVERPSHRNTSWDATKFEVAAHKYADISEPDYGAAILNNCKYGHKVFNNVLDLNLLRSPTYPDPDADRGINKFTYSFLPHTGGMIESGVMSEASMLNQPPVVFEGLKNASSFAAPCRIESDGVSLEALKKAEKENCLVVRLVETKGLRSKARLSLSSAKATLVETNLMEWADGRAVDCARGHVDLRLDPFEIRTYKLKKM